MPVPAVEPENPAGCAPVALLSSASARSPLLTCLDGAAGRRTLRPPPVRNYPEYSVFYPQAPAAAPARRAAWDQGRYLLPPGSGQDVPAQLLSGQHLRRADCRGYHRELPSSLGSTFLSLTELLAFSLKTYHISGASRREKPCL